MISIVRKLNRQLHYWLRQGERQRMLDEEMKFHLDSVAQDLKGQGASESEVARLARGKFGNLTQVSEEARTAWISRWISDGAQDLRYTLRALRRDSIFAIFAILIVGLGIGASSMIFSLVSALLLRPLPFFHQPDSLVWIGNLDVDSEGVTGETVPVGHFLALRDQNQSFSDVAAYSPFYEIGDQKLTGTGVEPQRLTGVAVSDNFLSVLGVKPQFGRPFNAADCQFKWNTPKVLLLSHKLWESRFDSNPGVVGQVLTLNDAPMTVVGIMPASFDFASVFAPGTRVDLYLPYPLTAQADHRGNELAMLGRLKPTATLQSARAESRMLGPRIRRRDPDRNFQLRLSLLQEHISRQTRPALLVLAAAVGIVMLIVCANLSNLLLARSTARQKEMAVRAALGAGRRRLIRQMLTESLVLSCFGALVGITLATMGTRAIAHLNTFNIPLLESVQVDGSVLAFTLLIAVVTGLIFGLVPALQAPAAAVHDSLKDNTRNSSASKKHNWIREALVVAEIAFACILLVGSGLLIRSFMTVLDVKLGFQPERAAAVRIDPGSQFSTQPSRAGYFKQVLDNVRLLPGIEAAGLSDVLPLSGDRTWGARAKGRTYSKSHPAPWAFVRVVSDGYPKAMGISLLGGRDFTEHDDASGQPVIIINETLAHSLWPGQNAVGQILGGAGFVDREVIGVVSDVRHLALEQESGCEMYLPIRQTNDYSLVDLVVRSTLPPAELASTVRRTLRAIDPTQPANEFRTLQQLVDKAVSPRRFLVVLLGGFSAFALVLASLGIYGVISYSVSQRTQEIGIRMALGASAGGLQAGILVRTLGLAAIGVALGFAISWGFAQALSSLLFGINSHDPLTFLGMFAILIMVAAVAGYLPARRLSQIDPMIALRSS